jgi:hypothetical protein
MALVNMPMPVPFVVFVDKATVGFAVVLQQTPRAVIAAPPSSVMLPPLAAVVFVIDVAAVVESVGNVATVFSGLSSFWQLKVIKANSVMHRKVFIVWCLINQI